MRQKYFFKFILAGVLLLGAYMIGAPPAFAAISSWQKGANIKSTWNGDFGSSAFQQSVDNLAAAGANYVSLAFNIYQSDLYSTDVQTGGDTPTDQALVSAINYVHGKGMKVMLFPHLESYSGQWRAYINPSDRAGWFANYGKMISHYAQLAAQSGAENFVAGSELINMSTDASNGANGQNWRSLIASIRSIYSGRLTYSANWGPSGFVDEKNHITFWDALDYIGISAYYNLYSDNQVQNLKNQWNNYNQSDISPLAQKWGKPVVFTEIGYKSVTGSHTQPWDYTFGGSADETEQVNDYTALFDYWNGQSLMQGVQLWEWRSDPNAGWPGDTDYTPQHKKAQGVIAAWFGGGSAPPPAPAPPPSTPPPGVSCPGPASGAFTACYFDNIDFTDLKVTRTDQAINFDWGGGSPDPGIGPDAFSAYWAGNFSFSAGSYTFTATTDDGMKVLIDGQPVIDKYFNQPATTYNAMVNLTEGTHRVEVRYYENGGNAVAKVSWTAGSSPTPPPPPGPSPSPSPSPPPAGGPPPSNIVYVNGYPTVNGNYIDCKGNIDNDPGHHTTNPNDTDPVHHVGQNCRNGLTANWSPGMNGSNKPIKALSSRPIR